MTRIVNSNTSARIPLLWKIVLLVQIIIWIPLPFLGFDSHHDGLILTTVHQLHDSIRDGGPWPFNQYGPFWALPFALATYPLPPEWVFPLLRIMTVGFYLLTGLLIYKSAKIISTARMAFISILIFFLSQPFTTDFGSDLVPWPSAVIMPAFALVTFLFFQINAGEGPTRHNKKIAFLIGILISTIFFSRAQIGFILFVAVIFMLTMKRCYPAVTLVILGFLFFSSLIMVFLNNFGWLGDAVNDEFVFGSLYLRGDTSTYPSPIFTSIGIFAFLSLLNFGQRILKLFFEKFPPRQLLGVLLLAFIIFFFASILFLNARDMNLMSILTTISRRLWISYYLSVILFAVFGQFRRTYLAYKHNLLHENRLYIRNALVLLSLVGELQIYPLFDQMHFWWGSIPAVILVVAVTKETFFDDLIPTVIKNRMTGLFLVLATLLSLLSITAQLSKPLARFPQTISKFLWVAPNISAEQERLQEFLNGNLKKDASILNLCANSDVFFSNRSFSSASRIFVLWPNITEVTSMKKSMVASKPDFVVTCSLSRIPELQKSSEAMQRKILFSSLMNPQEFASYETSPGMTWRLWRNIQSQNLD